MVSKGNPFGRAPQRSKYFYRSSAFWRENQQGNFALLIGELFVREKVPGRLAVVYKPAQPFSGRLGGDRIRKIKFTAPLSILLEPKRTSSTFKICYFSRSKIESNQPTKAAHQQRAAFLLQMVVDVGRIDWYNNSKAKYLGIARGRRKKWKNWNSEFWRMER